MQGTEFNHTALKMLRTELLAGQSAVDKHAARGKVQPRRASFRQPRQRAWRGKGLCFPGRLRRLRRLRRRRLRRRFGESRAADASPAAQLVSDSQARRRPPPRRTIVVVLAAAAAAAAAAAIIIKLLLLLLLLLQ